MEHRLLTVTRFRSAAHRGRVMLYSNRTAARHARQALLSVVTCSLLCLACGESEKRDGGGSDSTKAAADEFVSAFCGAVKGCCEAGGFAPELVADCEQTFQREQLAAVLDGALVFRDPERSRCVKSLEAVTVSCEVPMDSACSRIYDGTVDEGGSCQRAIECRAGRGAVVCVFTVGGDEEPQSGICRAVEEGEIGSPCLGTIGEDGFSTDYTTSDANPSLHVCDRRQGLYCDESTSTCQTLKGTGEPCGECEHGLYCRSSDATCMPELVDGSACDSQDQCGGQRGCLDGICRARKVTDGDTCQGEID
jgi:hypothetical protein